MAERLLVSATPTVEVMDALKAAGIRQLEVSVSTSQTGRNPWWIVEAADGKHFVKHLQGEPDDVKRRLEATEQFEQERHRVVGWGPDVGAPVLQSSTVSGVVIYAHIETMDEAQLGPRLRTQQVQPTEMVKIGKFLAALHSSGGTPAHTKKFTQMSTAVAGLSLPAFINATAGQLGVWRLLHRDPEFQVGVARLAEASADAVTVPGHGDLRVDQVLVAEDSWMVCDWEEYSRLDAAWEVGSLAGDLLSTVLGGSQSEFVRQASRPWETAEVAGTFESRIRYALPLLYALLDSYCRERPATRADESFRDRVAGFVGWHLIERMLAAGSVGVSVSGLARGIGGVGRGILLDPQGFDAMVMEARAR